MPAGSSSLAITRPLGSVAMSTSGVVCVWPAKSDFVLCQVLPWSVEYMTIAGALFSSPPPAVSEAFSPFVTSQSVPSGPVVIRGSVHGTPSEIFCTRTLDHLGAAASAACATPSTITATTSAAPRRRLTPTVYTPSLGGGCYACALCLDAVGCELANRPCDAPLPSASLPGAW